MQIWVKLGWTLRLHVHLIHFRYLTFYIEHLWCNWLIWLCCTHSFLTTWIQILLHYFLFTPGCMDIINNNFCLNFENRKQLSQFPLITDAMFQSQSLLPLIDPHFFFPIYFSWFCIWYVNQVSIYTTISKIDPKILRKVKNKLMSEI